MSEANKPPRDYSGPFEAVKQSTLIAELLDPNIAKNEREHAAARAIAALQQQIQSLESTIEDLRSAANSLCVLLPAKETLELSCYYAETELNDLRAAIEASKQ